MKKLNLKNKILVIIILFLGVFSFFSFSKAQVTEPPVAESTLVCKSYPIDKNTNTIMPVQKYWFLPLEGGYPGIVWKGPYDTFDSCTTALNVYKPVPIPGASGSVNTDTTYTPLAPLPNGSGGLQTTFDSAKANSFGDYLNILIRLFIGICAVLAMIMIVIGGIEYMTSEISGHKEEGKERITNAIFGLIIALGAYALLFTINPQLLDVSLSGIPQATIQEEETPAMAVGPTSNIPPSGPYALCTEGFEKITTTGGDFLVCKRISNGAKSLINSAWSQSIQIKLAGGSFRSKQSQENLRAQNCGGSQSIYDAKATCHPPTAVPGTSRHESGLAFDFTCEGVLIQTQDNKCFIWLKANAGSYGLINFSKEPWHWSFDGK